MPNLDYPLIVVPLSQADGGGYLASVPDLPGCMSDGETPEEAVRHVREAIRDWIDAASELGQDIPAPRERLEVA